MSTPRVTVLMSVFNGARYLREAIDSILHQTFADFELLIIDDASSDDSVHIVRSFADPRIRLLRNKINLGLTNSLNRGLHEARGEYIARQDADDRSHPRRLERQVTYLIAHPQVVLVGTQARTIDHKGKDIGRVAPKPTTPLGIAWLSVFSNPFFHTSVMFRREAIAQLGGYDETFVYNQDFELWSRVIGTHGVANLAEVLVDYRAHSESIAGRRDAAVLPSRIENAIRNKGIQRRNVLRETGDQELATEWPELWTAINVPWLTDEPPQPRRALEIIDKLWKRFRVVHPDAVQTVEIKTATASALAVVALYLAQRDRGASIRALFRATRLDPKQVRPLVLRWLLLLVSTPRLIAAVRQKKEAQ